MKKFALFAVVGLLVLAVAAGVVMAAPGNMGPGAKSWQSVTFTDAQKDELAKLHYQMLDLRRQMMQKYVEAGAISQDQADNRIATMKTHLDTAVKDGNVGMGMGMGHRPGRGMHGTGPQNCPNFQGQPAPVNQ